MRIKYGKTSINSISKNKKSHNFFWLQVSHNMLILETKMIFFVVGV